MPDNYETNDDGTLKLDAEGNPIPKAPVQDPPPQDSIPPWMVAVNAANIERQRVEEENRLLRQQVQTPQPPATVPLEPGALYNDPNALVDAISKRMEAQVAPLRAFQAQFERNQAYQNLKARAKLTIPAIANLFARGIEPLVDQEMANREPTEANFSQVIEMVMGRIAFQNPNFFSQAPQVTPSAAAPPPASAPNSTIPAHLRPTGTPNIQLMPSNNNSTAKDPTNWDENTRRLWKESGEAAEDFYDMTHAEPNELDALYKKIQAKKRAAAGAK